ncbi:hypothetical protein [Streptomyces sp. NPDC005549]|uniref:hypothetical protein n=1 Tax=Streptomyces sp. NPDC005549 TaxID=3154888 RepID=UPI0033A21DA2
MTGPACGNNPNYRMSDGDRQAVDSFRAYLTARGALQRIRSVLETEAVVGRTALEYRGLIADALMTDEPSLSPFYEHPECGFHWHGRDGMDVPMRDGQPVCPRCELRRMADETPAAETEAEWARPETEEEKLAKCRRMAKALSAPPVAPPEWKTTTEWPDRHKRPGDRRVHATARFVINNTQWFWTACGKHVGRGGTPMSRMPVDCRDCKRATTAGARQDGAQPS